MLNLPKILIWRFLLRMQSPSEIHLHPKKCRMFANKKSQAFLPDQAGFAGLSRQGRAAKDKFGIEGGDLIDEAIAEKIG